MIGRTQKITHDESGSTIIEFAFVLVPMLTLILGAWEMGRQVYVSSIVQGVVIQAARKAALEGATTTAVKTYVDGQLAEFAVPAKIGLTVTSFKKFTGVGAPEKITTDTAPLGSYNAGDCYVDVNNNGSYDTQQGSNGIGTAEDALRVRLTVEMNRLSPVGGWIGYSDIYQIDRTTFVQAEPFAGIIDPPTRCS